MTTTLEVNEVIESINEVNVEVAYVDENMAYEFIESNIENRKLKKSAIKKYVKDILAGNFLLSDSAICFDQEGKLINGQNRLWAIIEASDQLKKTIRVPFIIVRNMHRICATVMDQGMRRTDQDNLHFAGLSIDSVHEANIIKHLLYPKTTAHKINQHELIACHNRYSKDIQEVLSMCQHFSSVDFNRLVCKGVVGRAYINAKKNGNKEAMEIIQDFCHQFGNERPVIEDEELLGNVIVLRSGLLKHFPKGNSSANDTRATFEKYLKDILDNKIIKKIRRQTGSDDPVFPKLEIT